MDKSPVIQSNYLTSARYDYDVVEKRIIYHILLRIKNNIFDGIDEGAIGRDMDLLIPENQLKKTDNNDNHYRDYRRAVKRLRDKTFSINLPNGWIETGFLLRGQYITGTGLELTISRDVIHYLYDLSKGFTALDATVAITLQSKYAQRFYEWCCRWRDKGQFSYTPDELREVLGLKQPTKWLKQFVIEVARRGIKELYDAGIADIYLDYEEKRGGKGRGGSVLKWKFIIRSRNEEPKEKAQNEDFVYVINVLKEIYSTNTLIAESIFEAVSRDSETLKDFSERLLSIQRRHQRKPILNFGGYIRTIAREEYGFEDVSVSDDQSTSQPQSINSLIKAKLNR